MAQLAGGDSASSGPKCDWGGNARNCIRVVIRPWYISRLNLYKEKELANVSVHRAQERVIIQKCGAHVCSSVYRETLGLGGAHRRNDLRGDL